MTVQRRAPILSWREWLAAEFTIFRSILRGLRRHWMRSSAVQRMKAMVWAVSPQDGHRHAFDLHHLSGAAYQGLARAWCSHPAPRASLQATIRRSGPLCLACAAVVGEILANASGGASCRGTH
ncbi:MAG: hypothetical protein LC799_22230 [Actinobacteria bacterium]|nr:hypothetical protein [Actinomycetota bacterium]